MRVRSSLRGEMMKKRVKQFLLPVSFLVVLGGTLVAAQAPPILYQPDPDSPIGKRNPRGAQELDQFGFLIGDWDVSITWEPPGGKPTTYNARWHNHWIIDGAAVMQEWRGPYLTGTEIRYFNQKTGKWTGRNLYVGGEWKETVAEWKDPEMIVTILDAEDKSGKFLNRETYYEIKADSFKMKSERSYDDGKTWAKGAYFMEVVRSK